MGGKALPYLMVEHAVLKSPVLSAADIIVYIAIKSFRNRKSGLCFPSIAMIVARSKHSRPTVLKSRKRLRELGLIAWGEQDGWKRKTHYRFPLEDSSEEEISRILGNLQMVKKETNVDGKKQNHQLVKPETIYGLVEKMMLGPIVAKQY